MALSGSFAAAGHTQWVFETGGIAIFLVALWRILRRRALTIFRATIYLTSSAAILACGAWLAMPQEARFALWIGLIIASLWLSRPAAGSKCACTPAASTNAT